MYLACVWTRNLDESAGVNGSHAVFITYVVSFTICYGIYALSGILVARHSSSKDFNFFFQVNTPAVKTQRKHTEAVTPQRRDARIPINIPMRQLAMDIDSESQSILKITPVSIDQASVSHKQANNLELVQALNAAAQLRRDSAAADERIAQLYECLAQQ